MKGDTQKDTHTAAALNADRQCAGQCNLAGIRSRPPRPLTWLRDFGEVDRVGVEGAGSYGSGLAHHLRGEGVHVVEVNRPNRQARRRHGKSNPADADAAAPCDGRQHRHRLNRGARAACSLCTMRGVLTERPANFAWAPGEASAQDSFRAVDNVATSGIPEDELCPARGLASGRWDESRSFSRRNLLSKNR